MKSDNMCYDGLLGLKSECISPPKKQRKEKKRKMKRARAIEVV